MKKKFYNHAFFAYLYTKQKKEEKKKKKKYDKVIISYHIQKFTSPLDDLIKYNDVIVYITLSETVEAIRYVVNLLLLTPLR